MKNNQRIRISALGLLALSVALLVAACTPAASTSPSPTTEVARTASGASCSSMWMSSDNVRVEYRNVSDAALSLKVFNVDCYDWDGDSNPKRFDGAVLTPGSSTGPQTLAMRPIPEQGGVIRPWNMQVCVENECGQLSPRFEYKPASIYCNTTLRSQSACIGQSLCTSDANLEVLVSTAVIKRNDVAFGEITATTNCFVSTDDSLVILNWKKY